MWLMLQRVLHALYALVVAAERAGVQLPLGPPKDTQEASSRRQESTPPPPTPRPKPRAESQLSTLGPISLAQALVKHYEGCKLVAYLCPARIPTIGYGHTQGVRMGTRIDQDTADRYLAADLQLAQAEVRKLVTVELTVAQEAALVSFMFNVGGPQFRTSTLLRRLNARAYDEVPAQLLRWTHGGGKELPGLVKRRTAEAYLWQHGVLPSPLP